jgi:alkanesulfonate monooxygenase SsuD/methylene tetrahydromethanopterin reductase-like flavin-dependent oxidoreductase (luciferase family)
LGRMAAEAEGMTLGTGVMLLSLQQPVDVAEQLATLDVITGGRLIVGVGLGYRDAENEALGLDPRQRVGRFEEALQVVERLWSGEPVRHEGTHFALRDVRISMPPLQRPRPPIWLAANTDAGVRRAARLGDAWLMNPAEQHRKPPASLGSMRKRSEASVPGSACRCQVMPAARQSF